MRQLTNYFLPALKESLTPVKIDPSNELTKLQSRMDEVADNDPRSTNRYMFDHAVVEGTMTRLIDYFTAKDEGKERRAMYMGMDQSKFERRLIALCMHLQ